MPADALGRAALSRISLMARICILLALLLLVLTFNAYACVLPPPAQSKLDCSSPLMLDSEDKLVYRSESG